MAAIESEVTESGMVSQEKGTKDEGISNRTCTWRRADRSAVPAFPYLPSQRIIMFFYHFWFLLGAFCSAFEIECNYVIAALVLLASAVYFSFLFSFQKSSQERSWIYSVFYILCVWNFDI